jgi:Family of unknown function (DUF6311)
MLKLFNTVVTRPRILWAPLGPVWAYFVAALIGLWGALAIFNSKFFIGKSGFFEDGDPYQHMTAWLFFAKDSWHFPLMWTERLSYPGGLNVGFADVIPLAALLFKPFASFMPAGFHYFGLWYLVAFMGQAMAATFFARALGLRHLAAVLVFSFFAVTWPTLLNRHAHAALSSHFLLLMSLSFYILGRSGQWSSGKATTGLIGMCVVGMTIHPYFVPLLGGILFAFLLDQALSGESLILQVRRLATCLLLLLGLMGLFGYFGQQYRTEGYNFFAMNLIAPVCGNGKLISCVFANGPGQTFEAYNYLGAGLLMMMPIALLLGWRELGRFIKSNPGLFILLLGFLGYAVSNRMFLGDRLLFEFPMPSFMAWITGTFRMGPRFVWPIGYLILAATLYTLLSLRTRWAMAILVIGMVMQWSDGSPLRAFVRAGAKKPWTFNSAPWEPLLKNTKELLIYPTYGCGPNGPEFVISSQHLAGHFGLLLNTGDSARRVSRCAEDQVEFNHAPVPGAAYMMAPAAREPFNNPVPPLFRIAADQGDCYEWRERVVCLPGVDQELVKASSLGFVPYKFPDHPSFYWDAPNLSTQAGVLDKQAIVPSPDAKPGYLHVGPFISLPEGRYKVTIRYGSGAPPDKVVGKFEIAFGQEPSVDKPATLAKVFDLQGTNGADLTHTVDLLVTPETANKVFHVRSRAQPAMDIRVIGVQIDRPS